MNVPCTHCKALHWIDEQLSKSSRQSSKFSLYCLEGGVSLLPLEQPPASLSTLLTLTAAQAIKFREDIWKYNRAFAFTSLGVNQDHSVNAGGSRSPPVFCISGELRHWSGALTPPVGQLPHYTQLYIYEPQVALNARVEQNSDLDPQIISELQTMLAAHHQYIPKYKHAFEILGQHHGLEDIAV